MSTSPLRHFSLKTSVLKSYTLGQLIALNLELTSTYTFCSPTTQGLALRQPAVQIVL